ncbi:MAG: ATP-binding cassette domain-containing protein [Cyclobacteriaceae bacterium]
MIEVKGLSFSYGARKVLDNISFSSEVGEIIPIIGPSGSGKSTLLKLISNLSHGFSGEIRINGFTPKSFIDRATLSFMFQKTALLPHLSLFKNVTLPFQIKNEKPELERIEQMLSMYGLAEFKEHLPYQLSHGMQSRVALIRSFITKPEVLLLDEPFSALDFGIKQKIYQDFKSLTNSFRPTTLLVTHDVEEAFTLTSKKILLLDNGKMRSFDGTVSTNKEVIKKILVDVAKF